MHPLSYGLILCSLVFGALVVTGPVEAETVAQQNFLAAPASSDSPLFTLDTRTFQGKDSPLFTLDTRSSTSSPVALSRSRILGCSPNPFNPSTVIEFELSQSGRVDLDVFDVRGRLVRRLLDQAYLEAGEHRELWRGRGQDGRIVSSGVYYIRFTASDHMSVVPVTLIK